MAIEIEFKRHGDLYSITRDQIESQYIKDPLMQRYIKGKTSYNLAEIVEFIKNGESAKMEEQIIKRGVKMRETKYIKEKNEKEKKNKKEREEEEQQRKKLKDMKKKDIEKMILEKRKHKQM